MVRIKKWYPFFGPKFQFLAKKSDFCHTTPISVNSPFVALRVTVHFPPWERFFDFPFPSYSHFRKKIRLTQQKVFPLPTVGAPSASNSPGALSAQARALRGAQAGCNPARVVGGPGYAASALTHRAGGTPPCIRGEPACKAGRGPFPRVSNLHLRISV